MGLAVNLLKFDNMYNTTYRISEGGGEQGDRDDTTPGGGCAKSNSSESLHQPQTPTANAGSTNNASGQGSQPRTASIRSRPTSSRITAAELEVGAGVTSVYARKKKREYNRCDRKRYIEQRTCIDGYRERREHKGW